MTSVDLLIAALAAVGAGAVNALAGGGTLISFPVLVALGVPPVAANITNTVALCPGYFGAAIAQLPNLKGQRAQLLLLVPVAVLGGITGGMILVRTGERTFTVLVPVDDPCRIGAARDSGAYQEVCFKAVVESRA